MDKRSHVFQDALVANKCTFFNSLTANLAFAELKWPRPALKLKKKKCFTGVIMFHRRVQLLKNACCCVLDR